MSRHHPIFITAIAAAIACACAACSPQSSQSATTPPPSASNAAPTSTAAAPATASTAPAPGIDLAGVDHSVKPGDDFFLFANGAWLKTATIPPEPFQHRHFL